MNQETDSLTSPTEMPALRGKHLLSSFSPHTIQSSVYPWNFSFMLKVSTHNQLKFGNTF